MKAYEINETADRILVTWPANIPFTPRTVHEKELGELVRDGKELVFDFSLTRVLGTRWIRLVQRLSIARDDMGKMLLIAGLHETLLEKADLIAIRADLHIVDSAADMDKS